MSMAVANCSGTNADRKKKTSMTLKPTRPSQPVTLPNNLLRMSTTPMMTPAACENRKPRKVPAERSTPEARRARPAASRRGWSAAGAAAYCEASASMGKMVLLAK